MPWLTPQAAAISCSSAFALRAQHKLLRGQHVLDGRANFRRDRFELRTQVEHRNHFRGSGAAARSWSDWKDW